MPEELGALGAQGASTETEFIISIIRVKYDRYNIVSCRYPHSLDRVESGDLMGAVTPHRAGAVCGRSFGATQNEQDTAEHDGIILLPSRPPGYDPIHVFANPYPANSGHVRPT